jgi:hypothetical protein
MQTGLLLVPSEKRLGPRINITSDQLRPTRSPSTPTRRPPLCAFDFQGGKPMRIRSQWEVIKIPGLSHGVYPEEHVWNRLGSLSDKSYNTYMCPGMPWMSLPPGIGGTFSTPSSQTSRPLSMSISSSVPLSMYQSTPNVPANSTEIGLTHRRTESHTSSTTTSSTRPHRPIIDGSLKCIE